MLFDQIHPLCDKRALGQVEDSMRANLLNVGQKDPRREWASACVCAVCAGSGCGRQTALSPCAIGNSRQTVFREVQGILIPQAAGWYNS